MLVENEVEPYFPVSEISSAAAPRFTTILLSSVLMLAGIGGAYCITQLGEADSCPDVTMRQFQASEIEAEADLDPAIQRQNLTRIRESLGLNMSEMAQIFGVSRTALYGWFNGVVPHPKQTRRINGLLSIADVSSPMQVRQIALLKNVPLSQGKTLLQVLASDGDVLAALTEVREVAITRAASTKNRIARMAGKEKAFGGEDITPSFSTFE